MKTKHKWLIVAGVAVVAGLFGALRLNTGEQAQHFTAKVERGGINDVVEATGTINSVITVQVGSQVSGTIAKLNVDFNSRVHKGDVVALIDPALFKGALLQATADLKNAQANLEAARANLEKAKAALVQTKADFDRAVGLTKDGVMSKQQLDLAKSNYDAANASVDAAAANITQAEAQISQKEAAVSVAQTNLDYTVIRSPIDGTVVARKVDALPKQTFQGVVSQVRMNPTMVQSVVTYDTIIEFANPELKLFPGMTAYVTIPVSTAPNVMKLPNTALRYKPPIAPEEVLALYKRYGIEGAEEQRSGKNSAAEESAAPTGAQNLPRAPKAENAVVWKLHPDQSMEPVRVSLGITDHAYTEVSAILKGDLREGDDVIIRSVMPKNQAPGTLGH